VVINKYIFKYQTYYNHEPGGIKTAHIRINR